MLLSHTQLAAQTSMHVSTHVRAPAGVRWASPRLRLHLEVLPGRGHRKLVQSPAPRLPCRHASMTDLVLFLHTQTPAITIAHAQMVTVLFSLRMFVIRNCSCSQSFNWFCSRAATHRGCGVFGGCPHLKALIQWVAASSGGIKIKYFPFDMVLIFPLFALELVLVIAGNVVC